ncbi:ATP-binding protein [Prevotella communis]|uniref:DEAD/DEAH box helicase n=1 Tax=Prevotella communis TaxID=2913614 RepID=UPI001ED9D9FE|nr:ATP-binding protein [Prevotella communis]UKK67471.1 ATP-binding protein [Prevotella communis]UKK70382.1 ATP-binding protein [Prevotella communis]
MINAKEQYDILQELAAGKPSTVNLRQLHEVIKLCAAEGCRSQGGTFGNLFSQIDYVCKHYGLKAQQKWAIQQARRHSNGNETLSLDEWHYDLRAVTLLISTIFHEDVPGSLLQLLPVNLQPQPTQLNINKRYIRCIVRSYDDKTITADSEEGEIVIDYGNTDGGRDFAYLQKILREGMQLNLLDCHYDEKIVPGLIVVEPDFMLDISSLAACFTAYGHHPLLYTVSRLKPRPNTQATLLGNFAGTALDDIIHNPQVTLQQSLQRSYREQADRFAACEDFNKESFEQAAAAQMENIRQTTSILNSEFLIHNSLLEPSFVCEHLGLQGRVDLMTADMSLLVEQKSGKNQKIEYQSHDAHGLQLESHYVQLLLYYGILRYNFNKSDNQVDTRLLYSRYAPEKGLIAVNYYRTLFREAIKLRNQIVATELLIARDGFGRIIPLLNADIIYKGVARDGYFHRYILPELLTLNSYLLTLDSLERAYYERMMTFVYREQRAQKLGSSEQTLHHAGGCSSDLWLMPLNEKQEQGNIIMPLHIIKREKTDPDGGYNRITLRFSNVPNASPLGTLNFRKGDMIYLYQYDEEPNVRKSILYKGSIEDIHDGKVIIQLNDGQQNESVFALSDKTWAIEHGGSDVGTNSNIRSIHQFIQSSPQKKALLLGQRTPEADTSLTLSQSYSPYYDDILLKVKQARDYFLLVGPPGTGKTSMALRFMVEEELKGIDTSSILLMAYTNRAVDEIRSMLEDAGLADDERILTGTTSMMQARPFLLEGRHFSLAIVDEASQVLEPGLIGLLSSDQIDRFVLVGDHKQLPAVVQQNPEEARIDDPLLRSIGLNDCRQSLFQRLYNWEVQQQRTQFIGTLHRQGRMHPDVASFASNHFYHAWLQPVPLPHQQETAIGYDLPSQDAIDDILKTHRIVFFDSTPNTIDLALRIRRFYGERFNPEKTLGIIVTYRHQIAAIREVLPDISIDTVERYQGSQRDVIIYDVGVSRQYQLDFLTASTFTDDEGQTVDRKLNVALTRARKQMIIVGCSSILRQNTLYRQLIDNFSV